MSKKVLIISSSLRADSNSDALAQAFAEGARTAGSEVELVRLAGKTLGFCRGCLACQKTGRCVIRDDGDVIAQKMLHADVLVFATPVYYYGMSGQLKTLLDRANPLFASDYAFRDVYLLCTSADEGADAADGTRAGIECWLSCFGRARLAGCVHGAGVDAPGAIAGSAALDEARALGARA